MITFDLHMLSVKAILLFVSVEVLATAWILNSGNIDSDDEIYQNLQCADSL